MTDLGEEGPPVVAYEIWFKFIPILKKILFFSINVNIYVRGCRVAALAY